MRGERISRVLAAAATLGLCAVALSASPAGAAVSTATLTMSCDLAAIAPTPVTTTISAQLPETVPVGPATVSAFAVTITLPESAVATLRGGGATSVGAAFTAAMTATWGQEPLDVTIPPLSATDVPLPETGALTLSATAYVAPLVLPVEGPVMIAVPQLITTLSVHKGESSSDAACAQDPGQTGELGTITVLPADPGSSTPTTPSTSGGTPPSGGSSASGRPTSSVPNTTDPKHPRVAPLDDGPPPDQVGDFDDVCTMDAPGGLSAGKAWYKIDGPIHMRKLDSDLVLPVGDLAGDLELYLNGGSTGAYICVNGTALVPDSPGYFVMFDFAPVTATAHTMPGVKSRTKISSGYLISRTEATIRLSDVKVNGVALDVGPNCHTSTPAVIRLAGPYQGFTASGKVPGLVDVPAFVGCAHGSDVLDPLFNGLVAADGNTFVANIVYKCFYITCNGQPVPGTTPASK